jgi:hypothetical protein
MLPKFIRIVAGSAITLAACSGGNSAPVNEGCPVVMPGVPAVLYPSSSQVVSSNGGFNIITAFQYSPYVLTLQASGYPTVMTASPIVPAPTPLPAGAATPMPGATPAAYAVPNASLQAGVTYSIVAMLTFPGDCGTQLPTLGTFTTAPTP